MLRLRQFAVPVVGLAMTVFAAGCGMTGRTAIPAGAQSVASGNRELMYTPDRRGTIYVYDTDHDKMVYSTPVQSGDRLQVNAADNRITLNGRTVSETKISDGTNLKVFFDNH